MSEANIYKAQGIADIKVENSTIFLHEELPPFEYYKKLGELDSVFEEQAKMLEYELYSHLPGGTYDRLLGELLKRKASHFTVTLGAHE